MAISFPRKYLQFIKYTITCLIICIFFLFTLSLTIESPSLTYNLNRFQIYSENELLASNQSLASSLTYQIETMKDYPHLPVQILTKNRQKFLKLKTKTKKLILLFNSWFTDPAWTMKSFQNHTNSGNMSELYCSFLNNHCEITNDMNRFNQSDGVIFHLIDYFNRSHEILKQRQSWQRFIFALWEPPINSRDLRPFKHFFNWTMTYRFDAHIFASYYSQNSYLLKNKDWLENPPFDYRIKKKKNVLYKNLSMKQKKGTAAALISNCVNSTKNRLVMIDELQKYIDVTVYGKCGKPCPVDNTTDCRAYIAENYYFILAIENSFCQDYATEKLLSAIQLPIIPVVYGGMNYTRLIPPSAYVDIRKFSSLEQLAHRLIEIKNNWTLYEEYFHWKKDFLWGGFSSFMTPLCDLCLRLHLDQTPNIIEDLHQWWFDKTCKPQVTTYLD